MMLWTLYAWTPLLLLLNTFSQGHDTPQEGYTLSPSGYHICPGTELVPMTTVISYQRAYTQMVPCGGWLPWNMCNVTRYSTVYKTEVVPSKKAVIKCCEDYEQVGSYCALAFNRSSEFMDKPGICPVRLISASGPHCFRDSDCPDWQKCCQTENHGVCVEPQPHVNTTSWLNVTVTVKATYSLVNTTRGIFNHTRLLHSVVTGALSTLQVSVHHIHSWSSGWYSTSSCLLLGSSQLLSLTSISDSLLLLLENIEEVTAVDVKDVDECAIPLLRQCSPLANCINTPGSYSCMCSAGSVDLQPSRPGTNCKSSSNWNVISFGPLRKPPRKVISTTLSTTTSSTTPSNVSFNTSVTYPSPVSSCTSNFSTELSLPKSINLWAKHVTSFSFHLFWDVPSQINLTTQISLFHGTHQLGTVVTELSDWTWTNLQPGVLYTAQVALCMCGSCGKATELKVKTDAQTLKAVARITNYIFNDTLRNPNSEAYKMFSEQIRNETLLSLPSWILELVHSNKVMVLITNLTEGSIMVTFTLVFLPNSTQDIYSIAVNLMESLQNSKEFILDTNSTRIEDVNECTLGEADCSQWAECNDNFGSYTCECLYGYTDANPERPGRTCQVNNMTTSGPSPESPSTTNVTTAFTTNSLTTNTATTTSHPVNKETQTFSSSSPLPTSSSSSSSTSPTLLSSTLFKDATVSPSTAQSKSNPGQITTTSSATSTVTPPSTSFTTQPTAGTDLTSISNIMVECSTGFMIVFVSHHFLKQNHIPASSLYLGTPSCNQTDGNETHVMLLVAWGTCETQLEKNSQNSTVQVTLYSTDARLQVPVICTYINSIIISAGYTSSSSSSGFDTISNVVYGSGMYHVTVRLLNGTDPLPQNYTLSPDDEVIIEVGLSSNMTQIKVVINQCWANPSFDPNITPQNVFFENSCPVPDRHTTVLQNGESTQSLLAVNLYHLLEYDIIYLHCHIQICIETSTSTCRPDCSNNPKLARTSRGANVIGMTQASYGPLLKSHLEDTLQATVWNMRTIGFILLALGVCVLALAAVAVVLFCRRRMGNYNFQFKPRKENSTYHVFDT